MRSNIRDVAYLGLYEKKVHAATEARRHLLLQLLSDMYFSRERLEASSSSLMAHLEMPSSASTGKIQNIVWRWRPHSRKNLVRPIEVLLCVDDRQSGRRSQQMVSLRDRERRISCLTPILGKRKAYQVSRALDKFLLDADQAARWASASQVPSSLNEAGTKYGIRAWIEGVSLACEAAAHVTTGIIEEFFHLNDELIDLSFEFNEAQQPVRFHSIVCRREVSATDKLAPSAPRFRVVEFFDRKTGKRSSRDVQSYKMKMAVEKIRADLRIALGREPGKDEVKAFRHGMRARLPSPWLTAELISHCKLGKHSAGINRLQKKMADAMGKWEACHASIQALF